MGLKLHHIDSQGARGDLDGLPFVLRGEARRFRAEIGAGRQSFRAEGDLDPGSTLAQVRNAVYHVVARYRNAQRKLAL